MALAFSRLGLLFKLREALAEIVGLFPFCSLLPHEDSQPLCREVVEVVFL